MPHRPPSWGVVDGVCVVLVGLLGSLPLWDLVPSTDWAQHMAAVDILARLWAQDAAIMAHYTWQLQPVGYHLLYAVWTPLAVLVGTEVSSRIMLLGLYVAHGASLSWCLRRTQGPQVLTLAAIPLFYGVNFVWGFAPTMMGVPLTLMALGFVVTGPDAPKTRLMAAVAAAAATSAHIVFWPVLTVLAAAVCGARGLRRFKMCGAMGAGSLAVALPGLGHVVRQSLGHRDAMTQSTVTFEGLTGGLRHLNLALRCVDHSWHQAGQLAALGVLLAALACPAAHADSRSGRALGAVTFGLLGLVWVIPVEMDGPSGTSWLLNLRGTGLIFATLAMWAGRSAVWHGRFAASVRLVWVAACCCVIVGVVHLASAFEAEVAPFVRTVVDAHIQGRMVVVVQPERFGKAWPPLTRHRGAWVFVHRLSWQSDLFVGGQLPIVELPSGPGPQIRAAAARWVEAWRVPSLRAQTPQAAEALWGLCDSILLEGPDLAEWHHRPSAQARLVGAGAHWVLLSNPQSARRKH